MKYKRYSALFKAEWQAAIRPAARMGITRRAVNERAQGKAGRPMAEKTDFAPGESKALLEGG
jgi:hypothetical protein